uniref:Uncharacterized protein n=1 Tax=Arundo donax TaxID=35708 RepID=A0A0A9DJB6_ARUDO
MCRVWSWQLIPIGLPSVKTPLGYLPSVSKKRRRCVYHELSSVLLYNQMETCVCW